MIRVCLAGATGWVGKPLAAAIRESGDIELVSAVARSAKGQAIGDVVISGSVEEALRTPSDVFVDYTSATAVKGNVLLAIDAGRHVVVGSSGMSDADYAEIDVASRAKNVGVIAVGNFAISAALLQRFALEAAKHMPSLEIIDVAYAEKLDAPSGTARELAWRLSEAGTPPPAPIHSLRLPGYTIGLEVRFGKEDERLTLTYDGGPGAKPYIGGTLLAIRRAPEIKGLVRGLDRIL
jgi:4-hydroxy-tetrahydrodipicolinate reductase